MTNYLSKVIIDNTEALIKDSILQGSRPINVLTLGVKNDGSEDCSGIINNATKTTPLYFPIGEYRIDSPLNIINSIYGPTYSQTGLDRAAYIVPHFATSDYAVEVGSAAESLEISNVSLKLKEGNSGFHINSRHWTYMRNISIYNVGSTTNKARCFGLKCESTNSRQCCIDSVTIMGTPYSVSTGIKMTSPDNRITNANIMYCQYGLDIENCVCYVDNAHLWTGNNDFSKISKEDFIKTRAVIITNSPACEFNNLYTDTAAIAVTVINSLVSITNMINWFSIPATFSAKFGNMMSIFYCVNGSISVTGGSLRMPKLFYSGTNYSRTDRYVRLTDVNFLIDEDISNYFGLASIKLSNQNNYVIEHPDNSPYCMVAAFCTNDINRDQLSEITLTLNNKIKCSIKLTKNTLTLTHITGPKEYIYYTYSNYVIKIYAYFTQEECFVQSDSMSYNAFPVNIMKLIDNSTKLPMLDGRTSESGLKLLSVGDNTIS